MVRLLEPLKLGQRSRFCEKLRVDSSLFYRQNSQRLMSRKLLSCQSFRQVRLNKFISSSISLIVSRASGLSQKIVYGLVWGGLKTLIRF